MDVERCIARLGSARACCGWGKVAAGLAVAVSFAVTTAAVPVEPLAGQRPAASPRGAVDRLFEGMRGADSALVRSVLAPGVRFASVGGRDGGSTIRTSKLDGWLQAIAESGGSWDERIYDVEIRRDGTVASVWAPYTFYRDGRISHCGTNSIELLEDDEGWKVTQISDTRRSTACPDPRGNPREP